LGKVGGKVFSMHSLTGISGLEAFVFKPGFHPAIVSRNEPGEQVDWGIIKLTPLETEKPARVAVTNLLANPVSFVGHLVEMRGSLTRLDPKSELFRRVRRQLDARHSSIETIPEEAVIFSFSEPPYESVFMTFATPAKLASLDRAHDTLLEGVFEFYIPVTAYNAPMRRGGLVAELRGFQGR
jgi:hypothetical protein